MAGRLASRFGPRLTAALRAAASHPHSSLYLAAASPALNPTPAADLLLLRHFSTIRRQPARPKAADIGARARQLQNRRLWTYALTFGCVAGFITIVLSNFQDQLVFYITPSDALEKFASNPSRNRFRLGGLVLEGSVVHPSPSSPDMEFVITDLITDILVRYEGSLPDLFREGHSVVVEGFLRPFEGEGELAAEREAAGRAAAAAAAEKARRGPCFFRGTEVLAKHDEKYMPKEVAAALERNKKKVEEEAAREAVNKEKN